MRRSRDQHLAAEMAALFLRGELILEVHASGAGLDTAPAVIANYFPWPTIAYVPLVDAEPSTLAIARRRDDDNPLVTELIDLVLEITHQQVGEAITA